MQLKKVALVETHEGIEIHRLEGTPCWLVCPHGVSPWDAQAIRTRTLYDARMTALSMMPWIEGEENRLPYYAPEPLWDGAIPF